MWKGNASHLFDVQWIWQSINFWTWFQSLALLFNPQKYLCNDWLGYLGSNTWRHCTLTFIILELQMQDYSLAMKRTTISLPRFTAFKWNSGILPKQSFVAPCHQTGTLPSDIRWYQGTWQWIDSWSTQWAFAGFPRDPQFTMEADASALPSFVV